MSKKVFLGITLTVFALFLFTAQFVFAESVSYIKSQMSDEDLENCEVMVISQNLYVPMRLEIQHERLPDFDKNVQIITESSLQFSRQDEVFIAETEVVDRHNMQLVLDYTFGEEKTREVYYAIYSQSNQIAEGTWKHDNPVFCKVFDFLALEPPPVYDAQYFEEKFLEVEGQKLGEIIANQEESEAFNQIMGMLGMISVVGFLIVSLVIMMKFNDLKRSMPLKPLRDLIGYVKKISTNSDQLVEHNGLQTQRAIDELNNGVKNLGSEVAKIMMMGENIKKNYPVEPVMPEPEPEPIMPKSKVDSTKTIAKKIGFIVKDQFVESKKDEEIDYEEKCKRMGYDDLVKECQKLAESINKHDNDEDREKYDIATRVLQKK